MMTGVTEAIDESIQVHVQTQQHAAEEARKSAAQLRRLAMRLIVRLSIYDTRLDGMGKATFSYGRVGLSTLQRNTKSQNERLELHPDENKTQHDILVDIDAPSKVASRSGTI
jgi:hypothetical protein